MPTAQFSAAPDNTNDATFRLWGKAISDAIAAVGMVRAADTGQINWATVNRPAIPQTPAGYEIWRFPDSLHATAPIYLKLEYGTGPASATYIGMYVTVGKSTDGAGAIGGVLGDGRTLIGNYGYDPTARPGYVSSDGSSLVVAPFAGQSCAGTPAFVVERDRDDTGAPLGTGVCCAATTPNNGGYGSTSRPWMSFVRASYATGQYVRGYPVVIPLIYNGLNSGADLGLSLADADGVAPVFPYRLHVPGLKPSTMRSIVGLTAGDAAANALFTTTVDGAPRTYRTLPAGNGYAGWLPMTGDSLEYSSGTFAMLWED